MTGLRRYPLPTLSLMVAWLPAYALQDVCTVSAMEGSVGTVESVRQVELPRDLHAFDPEVLEHSVRPETVEQLVVRLDVGPVVVFTQRQPHRLRAGQRVTVQLNGSIARVERVSAQCVS